MGVAVTEEQLKYMVERFLAWKLPDNFNPDGGVTFQKVANPGTPFEHKFQPVGTNLLDYTQATEMVKHMIKDMPPRRRRGKYA